MTTSPAPRQVVHRRRVRSGGDPRRRGATAAAAGPAVVEHWDDDFSLAFTPTALRGLSAGDLGFDVVEHVQESGASSG